MSQIEEMITPEILTHHIFTFLDGVDLFVGCVLVCRKWYELVWVSPKKLVKIHNCNAKLSLLMGLGRFNNVKGFVLYNFDHSTLGSLLSSKQICKSVEKLIIDGQDENSIGKEGAMLITRRKLPNLKYLSLKELCKSAISIILRADNLRSIEELWISNSEDVSEDQVKQKIVFANFPNLQILNGINLYETVR
ncbi:predicted protein [Naegleria gruberi]|uniref:Predicted protein n=1 Tax=Naegleria gruberi TaxID=5762 RepID=D2VLU8_NAEGR|nr:uncharacterized protein NAEGRDRAFT_69906 [Naegleria gruberi]EFC42118.1 predicted protein [Naegleria gruberi]|eukprot:XP_002674862.1 predicted protein [Naegleria gruberi strain NEG-M]